MAERVKGLIFGDDPREVLQRGNEVIKADLGFAIDIPFDWDVSADRTRLLVRGPGDAALLVELVPAARSRLEQNIAVTLARRAGLNVPSGSATTVNGLPAFVGSVEGHIDELGTVRAAIACVRSGSRVFLLAGAAAAGDFQQVAAQFDGAIRSFRAIPAAEAGRVVPERIDLDTARDGDTWERIARRHGGLVMASTLALLNRATADQPPAAGTTLKVVAASQK
jgi:predicted Zn-dependent protease